MRSIRTFLIAALFGCGARDDIPSGMSRLEKLHEIECTLYWTALGSEWFADETALYAGHDTDVILGFYRGQDEEAYVTSPLETFGVKSEVDTGLVNPFDLPVYQTTFAVDVTHPEAIVDPVVFSFFDAGGQQQLGPDEDIWLHFVSNQPGEPVSTNLAVSAAGYEKDTGECWLVYQ